MDKRHTQSTSSTCTKISCLSNDIFAFLFQWFTLQDCAKFSLTCRKWSVKAWEYVNELLIDEQQRHTSFQFWAPLLRNGKLLHVHTLTLSDSAALNNDVIRELISNLPRLRTISFTQTATTNLHDVTTVAAKELNDLSQLVNLYTPKHIDLKCLNALGISPSESECFRGRFIRVLDISATTIDKSELALIAKYCEKLEAIALANVDWTPLNISQSIRVLATSYWEANTLTQPFRKNIPKLLARTPPRVGLNLYAYNSGKYTNILHRLLAPTRLNVRLKSKLTLDELLAHGMSINAPAEPFCDYSPLDAFLEKNEDPNMLGQLIERGANLWKPVSRIALQSHLPFLFCKQAQRGDTQHYASLEKLLSTTTKRRLLAKLNYFTLALLPTRFCRIFAPYLFGKDGLFLKEMDRLRQLTGREPNIYALLFEPDIMNSLIPWAATDFIVASPLMLPHIQELLKIHINTTELDQGNTALHLCKTFEVAAKLIQLGARTDIKNKDGEYPLTSLVNTINLYEWRGPSTATVVQLLAKHHQHIKVTKALVDSLCGLDVDGSVQALRVFLDAQSDDKRISELFADALHIATGRQIAGTVEFLLNEPRLHDVVHKDLHTLKRTDLRFCHHQPALHTPLHCLFLKGVSNQNSFTKIASLLVEHGAALDALDSRKSNVLEYIHVQDHSDYWKEILCNFLYSHPSFAFNKFFPPRWLLPEDSPLLFDGTNSSTNTDATSTGEEQTTIRPNDRRILFWRFILGMCQHPQSLQILIENTDVTRIKFKQQTLLRHIFCKEVRGVDAALILRSIPFFQKILQDKPTCNSSYSLAERVLRVVSELPPTTEYLQSALNDEERQQVESVLEDMCTAMLHRSCSRKDLSMLQLLLETNKNTLIGAYCRKHITHRSICEDEPGYYNYMAMLNHTHTPLQCLLSHHIQKDATRLMLHMLVENGANLFQETKNGYTVFANVLSHAPVVNPTTIIRLLLSPVVRSNVPNHALYLDEDNMDKLKFCVAAYCTKEPEPTDGPLDLTDIYCAVHQESLLQHLCDLITSKLDSPQVIENYLETIADPSQREKELNYVAKQTGRDVVVCTIPAEEDLQNIRSALNCIDTLLILHKYGAKGPFALSVDLKRYPNVERFVYLFMPLLQQAWAINHVDLAFWLIGQPLGEMSKNSLTNGL